MSKNPYNPSFGIIPSQQISRSQQVENVVNDFCQGEGQHMYIITGVRGSGKTVLMHEITKKLNVKKDWVIVKLNPEMDLLESLASKLSNERSLIKEFKADKINLSFFGFGVELKIGEKITNIEIALSKMLKTIKKRNKKVLVTIDEATSNKNMRVFAGTFQILIQESMPLYLLMTGLYENINELQNEKNLTFLWRAPKIDVRKLSIGAIADNYQSNLKVEEDRAIELARMTNGYAYAFQVLGWQIFENGDTPKAIEEYKIQLANYVYDKIYSELSNKDKKVLYACAKTKTRKISDIRSYLKMETNQFNPYRKRLIDKGILNGEERGYLYFSLPFFDRYVLENYFEY